MASSGNFCIWNALTGIKDDGSSGITFAKGNTSASMTHNGISCLGTHGINSGKWYYEINYHADGNYSDGRLFAGWTSDLKGIKYAFFKQAGGSPDREGFGVHLWFYRNGSQGGKISYQSSTDFTGNTGASNTNIKATQANDIIMCAIDADNHKMYWGINGNWGSTNTNGATATNSDITQVDGWSIESTWQGSTWQPAIWFAGASSGTTAIINAGQDSSFAGTKTSGSANASDSNSVGNFYYTPPTNFLALSSANLPLSDDINPAQTDDDYPSKQFGAITWTGDGTTSRAITGLGFQPDFIWFKDRTQAFSNRLYDTSRGIASNGGKRLFSNTTAAENDQTSGQDISAVGADGFTLGASSANFTNYSSDENVAWCWRANGGTTASNSEGSTTCSTQANVKGGFSILTYTGTGSAATLGHGLEKAPEFIMAKRRSGAAQSWKNYHVGLGATKYLTLNASDAAATSSGMWNDTAPTSTLISIGNESNVSTSSETYIIYAWHGVEGFSKFGSFEGNSNADGPFIYTGFRPRLVFCKSIDATENWQVRDTARSTFNADSQVRIYWNSEAAEGSASTASPIDFLSNGFKVRGSNSEINSNTIIYGAWGDVSFKYNNTF